MASDWPGKHLVHACDIPSNNFAQERRGFFDEVNCNRWHFKSNAVARQFGKSARGPAIADIDQFGQSVSLTLRQFHVTSPWSTAVSTRLISCSLNGLLIIPA